MVSIKSTVVFITVAINLLVQAAPVKSGKNDGRILHVSGDDGIESKALGIDLDKPLNTKGKSKSIKRDHYYDGSFYGGRGNYNFNGILPLTGGGPGYGFGRSNVNVNGMVRPGRFEDDHELFDDVSAAKHKVKRDHHDHDHDLDLDLDDDNLGAIACQFARPNICATHDDWEGFHGFVKRHDLEDDLVYGHGHQWGCPSVAPPCLPHASHVWGGYPHSFAAGKKSNVNLNGIFHKRSEEMTSKDTSKDASADGGEGADSVKETNENKRDVVKVEGEESTVTISSDETDLSKRDYDEDDYYHRRPYYPPYGGYPRYPPYGGYPHYPPYGGYPHYPPYGGYPWGPHYGDEDGHDFYDEYEHGEHGDRFEKRGEKEDQLEKRGEHGDEYDFDDDDDHYHHYGGYYRRRPYGGYPWFGHPFYRGGRYHIDFDKRSSEQEVTEASANGDASTTKVTMEKRDHVNVFTNENYNVNSGNRGGAYHTYDHGVYRDAYPYVFADEFDKRDHLNIYNNENYNLDSFNQHSGYYGSGPIYYPWGEGEWDKRSEKKDDEKVATEASKEDESSSSHLAKRDHLSVYNNINYNDDSYNEDNAVHYSYPPRPHYPHYPHYPYYPWGPFYDEEI
ncbi:unnamed protein product [Cunninghamella blakesleeana]